MICHLIRCHSFSVKVCPSLKTSCLFAENVNETPEQLTMYSAIVIFKTLCITVKPVYNGYPWEIAR